MTEHSEASTAGIRSTLVVVGVLAAVAAWALPRAIQPGDAGEFATVMLQGGVPHPSGYPWMRILGVPARALAAVGLPPATAAAMPCALLGIAGFAAMHRVALHLLPGPFLRARETIATLLTLLLATAPPVVLHVFDSEVWGPLLFAVCGFTYLAVVRRSAPWVLGLVLGLAVSHHLTAVFLVPLAIGAAWPVAATQTSVLRAGLQGLAGSLLGLTPLFTLMLGTHGPDAAWAWGDTESLAGWVHHITRGDYGVFDLSLQKNSQVPAWAQLRRAWRVQGGALCAQLSPHWLLSGAVVLVPCVLAVRRGPEPWKLRVGLVGSLLLSGSVFPLAHNLDPTSPFGQWILERFDLVPLAMLIPVCALAFSPLPAAVAKRGRAGQGLAVAGTLLVLRQVLFAAWHGVPSTNPWLERYAVDVLRTPDAPQAIIVGTDDHRTFPILYAQQVLHEGERVVYIDASLLAYPWYRARLRTKLPALPDIDKPVRLLTTLQADPAWDEVPLYLTNDFSRHSVGLNRVPEGVLWRLVHPRLPPATADQVVTRHKAALKRYGPLVQIPFVDGHPFATDVLTNYLQTTKALGEALYAQGRSADAEALLRYAMDPS
ncbi:MAG: hypothetical protein KUG77_29710 [Nannocystaceae bacterium]|nr:hypothetical protein [Nannocystaceae bacterium]